MGKKILTFALAMLLIVSLPIRVNAETLSANGSVTFTGENRLDSNNTTDLASTIGSMQPGDDLVITIDVKNESSLTANYYMTNQVLQSLEETQSANASGGSYEYTLIYQASDGTETELFRSTSLGGEGTTVDGRVGLKGATSGLEEYISLETLAPGKSGQLKLTVLLDGVTQGNDYQNTAARLQFNFAVDTSTVIEQNVTNVVTRTETVEVVGDGNGDGGQRTNLVRTSDEANLLPFIIAAGISGLLLLFLGIFGVKERKKQRKSGAVMGLCLAVVLASLAPVQTQAAAYTYTVRLFTGAQGKIVEGNVDNLVRYSNGGSVAAEQVKVLEDGTCLQISGLKYNDELVFSANVAEGENATIDLVADPNTGISKYYVQGVRESGSERNAGTSKVTGDMDFVVAYGVQGNMTYYTVNFVDRQGNTLMPSQRYSGKIGDYAVVGYRYIENYQPYAYNLGKTLSENEAENVFNFEYTMLPTVTNVTTQTVTETVTVTVPGEEVEAPAPEEPVNVVPPAPGPEEEPEPEPAPEIEIEPETPPLEDQPEDFVDLDADPTPLSPGLDGDEDEEDGAGLSIMDLATPLAALPIGAKAGIGAAVVLGAGALIWFLVTRRKKESGKEEAK
ncbi:MAG: hypothetical protein NC432_05290 [Roseburia sp.]|nr:hypothetical protein [Roseburia sp.]MCM1097922.1 hypothetical protein [Ruminococcus flavefaciens]